MEFTYDLSQTPVIERRHKRTGLSGVPTFQYDKEDVKESATSPRRSLSLSTADSATFSGWKRPWMSQVIFAFICGDFDNVPLLESRERMFGQPSQYNWPESWPAEVSIGKKFENV